MLLINCKQTNDSLLSKLKDNFLMHHMRKFYRRKKINIFYIFIIKKYNKLINIKNTKFFNFVLLHNLILIMKLLMKKKKLFNSFFC